ncbi:MAG: cysteine--tRNA ligase [Candidatus Marinimicrobia bacterium]|nr:cysteine--tRNA ligase [Candidatus Neomarinimicrobiota bacterium]
MELYNTSVRKKVKFTPLKGNRVRLYTCGPTVYDVAHIGNFRAFVFEDFLKRVLTLVGYDVTHIMNITDVDDKTIQRSMDRKIPIAELTETYTQRFFQDLDRLKVIPADGYPRATDHVKDMQEIIQQLLDKEHAYISNDGSIYFAIDSYKEYGQLAQLDLSGQKSSERMADDDYTKENPQDFALWKSWKPEDGDVYWESPWGKGRPGWHIECSAMSMKYLGHHFDIHCGGVDNMFPHHENEIAQSVCATGKPFVNVWLHNEHLLVDGGKMSKSLGNFYTVEDLLNHGFTSEALRYILLSTHYRTKVNFSLEKKHEAIKAVQRVQSFWDRLNEFEVSDGEMLPDESEAFINSLSNDLDAPGALGIAFDYIRKMNNRIDQKEITQAEITMAINFMKQINHAFDFLSLNIEVPSEVTNLAQLREDARKAKDWTKSDALRDQLKELGWEVRDTPSGPKCHLIDL